MRLILLIGAFLLTMNISAQRLIKTPYESYMDSLALAKLDLSLNAGKKRDMVLTWRPYDKIKFTVRTRVNLSVIQKIDITNGVSDIFSELDMFDYWNVGSYDIRCKFYLNKRLRLLGRVVLTGTNTQSYLYTGGIILKF